MQTDSSYKIKSLKYKERFILREIDSINWILCYFFSLKGNIYWNIVIVKTRKAADFFSFLGSNFVFPYLSDYNSTKIKYSCLIILYHNILDHYVILDYYIIIIIWFLI